MSATCTDANRAELIAAILRAIPTWDAEAVPIESLCPQAEEGDSACVHCAQALTAILQVFDAVVVRPERDGQSARIKASAETAMYFLRSLASYVCGTYPLISNWNREGATDAHSVKHALASGAQFLYLMEKKRTEEYRDKLPTRDVWVSQAIIKAKVRGKRDPMYLMQYDAAAQRYQLIGGRKRPGDTDALSVMSREIEEELASSKLTYETDYGLKELLTSVEVTELSRTFGAYTRYHFTIFQAVVHRRQLSLGPNDRWISYGELMAGKTKDGAAVITSDGQNYHRTMDEALPGGLRGLALSLGRTQKRTLKEVWHEHRWQIIVVMLTILGIAATLFFGLRQ